MIGNNDHPIIRVVINPDGTVDLFGSKTSGGPLFPLELFNNNKLQKVTWNPSDPFNPNANVNKIVVPQNVVGVTQIDGVGYGQNIVPCVCYNPANNTPIQAPTKVGVTLLKRAGDKDAANWPMARNSGHIALESNTKGFVITRIAKANLGNISSPQEGMMVYDTTDQCLKIYSDGNWKCFSKPACP